MRKNAAKGTSEGKETAVWTACSWNVLLCILIKHMPMRTHVWELSHGLGTEQRAQNLKLQLLCDISTSANSKRDFFTECDTGEWMCSSLKFLYIRERYNLGT